MSEPAPQQIRVGVVSDTHGHVGNTRAAIEVLARENVDVVLHCGDIGRLEIVPLFERWPTHFVFGNVDHWAADGFAAAINAAGQTCHGRFGDIEIAGRRIALLHSDDGRRFRETLASGEYDLVCYGHTHVAESHYEGRTLVLNPGALYRASDHTIAIVDLPSLDVRHVTVV